MLFCKRQLDEISNIFEDIIESLQVKSTEDGVSVLCSQAGSHAFLGWGELVLVASGLGDGGSGQLEERGYFFFCFLINICNQQGAGKELSKACCFVEWRHFSAPLICHNPFAQYSHTHTKK